MRKTVIAIIIVGNERVGKSCLMKQFVSKKMNSTYEPTIGADFIDKNITVDGAEIVLQIWDTAGDESYQSFSTGFYKRAEGCVLVFDVTNPSSFESLETLRNSVIEKSEVDPENYPFVVIGNKIDEEDRKITTDTAQEWCKSAGDIPYFETSANDYASVENAFRTLVSRSIKYKEEKTANK